MPAIWGVCHTVSIYENLFIYTDGSRVKAAHIRLGVLLCDDVGGVEHPGPPVGSPGWAAHASAIRA